MREKWLRIIAPRFTAAAIFYEIEPGEWRALQVAPILWKHIHDKTGPEVKDWLKKKRYEYHWLDDEPPDEPAAIPTPQPNGASRLDSPRARRHVGRRGRASNPG